MPDKKLHSTVIGSEINFPIKNTAKALSVLQMLTRKYPHVPNLEVTLKTGWEHTLIIMDKTIHINPSKKIADGPEEERTNPEV